MLDRIDLHIEVPGVSAADLILPPPSEGSREVAARVARARDMQAARYQALGLEGIRVNAQANGPVLEEVAQADNSGLNCCATPPTRCACRPAVITVCCASRARLPTSMALRKSAGFILPRRSPIARLLMNSVARREVRNHWRTTALTSPVAYGRGRPMTRSHIFTLLAVAVAAPAVAVTAAPYLYSHDARVSRRAASATG